MALGALINSSAMVSISITGNSTPYYTDIGCIGIVDVGVAIRCKKKVVGVNIILKLLE